MMPRELIALSVFAGFFLTGGGVLLGVLFNRPECPMTWRVIAGMILGIDALVLYLCIMARITQWWLR